MLFNLKKYPTVLFSSLKKILQRIYQIYLNYLQLNDKYIHQFFTLYTFLLLFPLLLAKEAKYLQTYILIQQEALNIIYHTNFLYCLKFYLIL
jgi:hypothetical protein